MGNISASSQQLLVDLRHSRSLERRDGEWAEETDCVDLFTCYDRNKTRFLEREEGDLFFADLVELAMPNTPIQARKAAIEQCWDEFDNNPKDQKLGLDELEAAIRQCFEPKACLVRGLFSTKFTKFSARDFVKLVGFNQLALVRQVVNDNLNQYAEALYLTSTGLPPLHVAAFLGHSQLMDVLWPRVDLWRVGLHPGDETGANFSIFHCICLSSLPDSTRLSLLQQVMSFFSHPCPSSLLENYLSSACPSATSITASPSPHPPSVSPLASSSSSAVASLYPISPSSLPSPSSASFYHYYPPSALSSSASMFYSKPKSNSLASDISSRLFNPSHHTLPNCAGSPLDLLCYSSSPLCIQYLLEHFAFARWEIVHAVFRAAGAMQMENAETILKYVFTPTPLSQFLGPPTPWDVVQRTLSFAEGVLETSLSHHDRLPFARMLLQAFVDPGNGTGLDLQRLLCNIANLGNSAIPAAKLLFEFLADPNLSSVLKPTIKPMDEAVRHYNYPLISLLIEYGADFSTVSKSNPGIAQAISAGLEKVRAKMEVILECTPLKEVWLVSIVIEYVFVHALAPLNSQ